MYNTPYGTLELARDKAWTAAAFKTLSENASLYYNDHIINVEWNERITPVPGGVPYNDQDQFMGAVGVAGNNPETDRQIILEALGRLKFEVIS